MCTDRPTLTPAVIELQDQELAAFLRTLFAGKGWAVLRRLHPGEADLAILADLVSEEILRSVWKRKEPGTLRVQFFDYEFGNRRR